MLEGREFTVLTDNKPLIFAFKQKNDKASPRQLRHLQYISQFTTDIQHISGKDNIVADTLSRMEEVSVIDLDQIAQEQSTDGDFKQFCANNTSLDFKLYVLPSGKNLWCDVSQNKNRPYIPTSFRKKIFNQIHGLSHPGVGSTVKQLATRFIWPGINKEVKEWAQACINCQKAKITRHSKSKFAQFQEVDTRFSIVHINLTGPMAPSNGQVYCLTCIDRFTCWMEAIPLPEITAEMVSKAFYERWVCRFGVPTCIITDQGRQFEAQLFRNLAAICGAKVQHTTPYHPKAMGK
ncbi:Transposon Tf2-11 polyprotein [Araneus ventricosus]|uniref:RNA-directed DNA polymerase n=1 Tax=Araneus ventricosus TaxID=182803 RepID=A0A4Y2L8F2_ARAVE|nr:Transposon Tf2-11 polyprotein [Araneus ventricosus]